MQIVIAWAEKTALIPTGRHFMRDLNWFPEFRAGWEGRAAMWKRRGTVDDLAKAREYAAADSRLVLVFSPQVRDPLEKARQRAVELAEKSENDR